MRLTLPDLTVPYVKRSSWASSLRAWRLPLVVALSMILAYAMAPIAAAALAIAWFLYFAARFDNHTGSCLMLAVLVVLVIAILTTLVAFLGLFGRY